MANRLAVRHDGEVTGALNRVDYTGQNAMQVAVGKNISAAKAAFKD